MTERVLGPKESPRRRWTLLVALAVAFSFGLIFIAGARAVHDVGGFELDKNASNNTNVTPLGTLGANINSSATSIPVCETGPAPGTPFTILIEAERMTVTANAAGSFGGNCGGTKKAYTVERGVSSTNAASHSKSGESGYVSLIVSATKTGPDWDLVHSTIGSDPDCSTIDLVECAFVEDGIGPTTFIGGGSKDHLPISGWQHTSGASPDKAEILNAYAAKAIVGGDQILYFGMDRYAVDGSTDIGFWFFRGPVTANPDGTFTGAHQGTLNSSPADNDILALATFTQGGAATNIRVFRWVGSGGNESGTINGPDADAGDCLPPPPAPPNTNDELCGTVNNTTIEVPWNYQFKGAAAGKWIPTGGMFEGGINLTELGLEGCFTTFLAETRSSPEITAILKDFALGDFEACDAGLVTRPGNGTAGAGNLLLTDSNGNSIPDVSIGTGSVSVRDRATLSVSGTSTWSGTMDFWLCKVDAPALCDGTTNVGTKIGSAINVNQATAQPVISAAATVTSAGRYCWRGVFTSSTAGVPSRSDSTSGECFEVLPVEPTISTNATGPVLVGNSINDTATLGGTANKPGSPVINPTTAGGAAGGTITFRAYGPTDASCTGTPVYTSVVNVSGNNTYSAATGTGGTFTPTSAGTYRWIASYSGDSPNTLSKSGACNDTNESSVVNPKQPTISTNATAGPLPLGSSINDTATLGNTSPKPNGSPAGGTITFSAYGPFGNTTTCTGSPVYTSVVNVSGNGTYSAADGTGGTFTPTLAGTYNWIAVYSGDSPNTLSVSGSCGDANEGSVLISLQPSMTTAQSFIPNDSATITVSAGGGNLAGSVRFRLYENATCTGSPVYDQTVSVSGASPQTVNTTNSTTYVVTTSKTLSWLVEYTSTNTAHRNVTKACNSENTSLTISNGSASNTP